MSRNYNLPQAPTNELDPTANTNRTRSQNAGTRVTLSGANESASEKIIRVDDDSPDQVSWLMSVSAIVAEADVVATPISNIIGPIVRGSFGAGGSFQEFECDASPDSILSLPGTTVDASAQWGYILNCQHQAGAGARDVITKLRTGGLPDSAIITSGIKHGSPATPNATRTFPIVQDAGSHISVIEIPKFSNSVMLYTDDAKYANLDAMVFLQTPNAGGIVTYTGAEVLAIKNAGGKIPIPGTAELIALVSAGPITNIAFFLSFDLNI